LLRTAEPIVNLFLFLLLALFVAKERDLFLCALTTISATEKLPMTRNLLGYLFWRLGGPRSKTAFGKGFISLPCMVESRRASMHMRRGLNFYEELIPAIVNNIYFFMGTLLKGPISEDCCAGI
jgi:hypothetical protein